MTELEQLQRLVGQRVTATERPDEETLTLTFEDGTKVEMTSYDLYSGSGLAIEFLGPRWDPETPK